MQYSDIENKVSACINTMLNNYNTGISQEQFYKNNIVDATDVTEEDMQSVNAEVIQYCKENGAFAALPPFEEGSFIDQAERRFTHWKVLDVEDEYFRISMDHYPLMFNGTVDDPTNSTVGFNSIIRPCWYLACHVVVKVKLLDKDEHMAMLRYHPDFAGLPNDVITKMRVDLLSDRLRTEYHVGGVIESYEFYLLKDLQKIAKKGKYSTPDGVILNGSWVRDVVANTLEVAVDRDLNSMLFCSAGPILEMFLYINYMLSQNTTKASTHRSVSVAYSIGTPDTELRKERHFGKIKVVSVKKPKTVNKQNVQRVYTTMSWHRRSHVRHLKSGKVVPVKSATCTRHGVESTEVPQVIYRV